MSKATLTLDQVHNFCVFDGKPIPIERVKRNAVTCSKECAKGMERQRMLLVEQIECKYCRRPSTPDERESYKQWRKWIKDGSPLPGVAEATKEITKPIAEEVTEKITGEADGTKEYPYVYTRWNSSRKGQRCRRLLTGNENSATHVQIQFEDGETLIADKMNISSGLPKKYSEKRGPKFRSKSTLAAKQQNDEGEY